MTEAMSIERAVDQFLIHAGRTVRVIERDGISITITPGRVRLARVAAIVARPQLAEPSQVPVAPCFSVDELALASTRHA